jgi:multidrug efflux pump subunit AcrA (membrane-fusion protein)
MPGMTCEVKLVPYLKRDALAIPLAALGTDEIEGAKQLVALPGKGDQPIKREVTVGKRSDKLVEIVAGLREGEEILAEYPKEKE